MTLAAVLRFVFLVAFLLVGSFSACAPKCEGVMNGDRCETPCDDAACAAGSKCVDNACRPACKASSDCLAGEPCEARVSDHGTQGKYCVGPGSRTGGTDGAACGASVDCAEIQGFRCIGGKCTLTCETHAECGASGSCTGTAKDAEGTTVFTCASDGLPRAKGQYGTPCPNGDECDAANDFVCIGAGSGDVNAYCTRRFCASDGECPSGSFCSSSNAHLIVDGQSDLQPPCADTCGLTGDETAPDCVPLTDIGPGKHFQCGRVALVVNVCLHREFCSTCDSDADCRGVPNQVCAKDESGQKICTVLCDPNLDSCPWGNAAACGKWDPSLGVATCEHRSGSCHGTGSSCDPCVQQTDCPNGWCNEARFSGERYCVDTTVACSCPSGTTQTCTGGGCPVTPGNRPMTCYGGSSYASTPVAGLCIGAPADAAERASKESCWPGL